MTLAWWNTLVFAPALGWPLGGALAACMVGLAVFALVLHARRARSAQGTDETWPTAVRRALLCMTLALAVLTPGVETTTTSRAVNATDVVIAVDVTGSMAVSDASYGSAGVMTRLDAARKAVKDITDSYPDASFSAMRFGASASTDVPLTPDAPAIGNWADTLQPESTSVSAGSSLDAPLDQLMLGLKAMRQAHPDDAIIVYIVTDGEQTSAASRRSFSTLRRYIDDGFTVGVGSSKGGRIPVIRDGTSGSRIQSGQWVQDPDTGQPGISRMDERNLKDIADELGGAYLPADATHTLRDEASSKVSSAWQVSEGTKQRTRVNPVVWPLAIVMVVLLAWEIGSWIVVSRRLI